MENTNNAINKLSVELNRITMRGMKEAVTEYLSQCCYIDVDFSKHILNADKNLNDCIRYINKKAKDYLQNSSEAFEGNGVYGGDVPDELCFEWAKFYFETPEDILNPKIEVKINKYKKEKRSIKKVDDIENPSEESQVSLFESKKAEEETDDE